MSPTLSGRAVVVRVDDGTELGSAVFGYPHGVLDRTLPATGERLPPEWALQVPADYLDVLRTAVPAALQDAGIDPADVIGVGTDFTACTMLPTTSDGTPLCELPEFAGNPHAYVKLWRHRACPDAFAAQRGPGRPARRDTGERRDPEPWRDGRVGLVADAGQR